VATFVDSRKIVHLFQHSTQSGENSSLKYQFTTTNSADFRMVAEKKLTGTGKKV